MRKADTPLSLEDQRALSKAVDALPERLLGGAMAIIRADDSIDEDEDSIDLFVHELSPNTQRKLYRFVFGVRRALQYDVAVD